MLEKERSRIAKDIHDHVGASMTRQFMLCEMAKNNIADTEKLQQWLSQIRDTCHDVMQEMTHIIWALNPKNETFESMVAYIRRFSYEYLEIAALKCDFMLPPDMPDLEINVEKRRNIYLCLREALNNIVKHSSAKNVNISMDAKESGFILKITDDGIGIDLEKMRMNGNGLSNMKKRMEDVGGEFLINSMPGSGTEISFMIKFNPTF
jgi:signal transduction histidine kinase